MIEKLNYGWQAGGGYVEPTREVICDKINELIDTVNELQLSIKPILEERESEIKVHEEAQDMYDNAILDALKDKQVDVVVEPAENVQDKFAEQRKWIGKLCMFWDIDNNNLYYGPLTKIHDTSPYCYECNHRMCYANCEPVSEDLIYKGE